VAAATSLIQRQIVPNVSEDLGLRPREQRKRYRDDDHPEWNAAERAFAAAWRNQPKWVDG
jgi:hypothetical protein